MHSTVHVKVQYQQGCNEGKKFIITYTNQVVVGGSGFSGGGDSGSLIVTQNNASPTALLYAGSSTTIGNPAQQVLTALGGVGFPNASRHAPIPAELEGVRTQVIRTDRIRAYGWNEPKEGQARSCPAK